MDELLLLNAWCPMHDERDRDDEPVLHTSKVRLQFVALPGDPANDAWTCTDPGCDWFILVNKGSTAPGDFAVQS